MTVSYPAMSQIDQRKRQTRTAVPPTSDQLAEQRRWQEIIERINDYAVARGLSREQLTTTLFKGLLSTSTIKKRLNHPDECHRMNRKTKDVFEKASLEIASLPCGHCLIYDEFESKLSLQSHRHELNRFEGRYMLYRYGGPADVAEYDVTIHACAECGRPRVRWLAKKKKHRIGGGEHHGHVFILGNRLYVLGAGHDRLLWIVLQKADPANYPLAGVLLTEQKGNGEPLATKVVMRHQDANFSKLSADRVTYFLTNEAPTSDLLMGWRKV